MNELLKIVAIALVTVFAHMLVKQTKPEIAVLISIVGSIIIITLVVSSLKSVLNTFYSIIETTNLEIGIVSSIIKIVSIGYIAEFGANICIDAGAGSIADKILFAAKIVILIIAMPIITNVINMVVALL